MFRSAEKFWTIRTIFFWNKIFSACMGNKTAYNPGTNWLTSMGRDRIPLLLFCMEYYLLCCSDITKSTTNTLGSDARLYREKF